METVVVQQQSTIFKPERLLFCNDQVVDFKYLTSWQEDCCKPQFTNDSNLHFKQKAESIDLQRIRQAFWDCFALLLPD